MMKKIFANLPIKILSLAIAIVTWLIIMNLLKPMVSGFVNVTITLENEDYIKNQNKAYSIQDSRVIRINYMVQADYQTSISQSDFIAYVDLKDLDTTNLLPIHVDAASDEVRSHISNIAQEKRTLHVEIIDNLRKEFDVQYVISGNLAEGQSIGNIFLTPNIVYISGSNEAVETVDHVSIEIPVNNKEETFSGVAALRLYDENSNLISNDELSLSPETIGYSVFIDSTTSVNINTTLVGNVKTGYTYAGIEVEPSNIIISGPKGLIQNMYDIDLPAINIEGLDKDTEYTFNTIDLLPMGARSDIMEIKARVIVNENILTHSARNSNENVGPHLETSETLDSSIAVDESTSDGEIAETETSENKSE